MSIDTTKSDPTTSGGSPQSLKYKYLRPKHGSSYKQLFVMGRIFPGTLYAAYVRDEERMTMDEIAADYDIPLEAVQEAIAYYDSNPPEMLDDFRRDDALAEAFGMNDPTYKYNPTPKLLSAQEIARILNG